jgi:glutamine amidotransferase
MCRFVIYSGEPILISDLLHRPENSIVKQSHAALDEEDRVNGDGFGLGWYVPEISPEPAVFRSPRPAWSCASLRSVASHTRASLFFGHVRAASEGLEVSEANCHPFSAGPFLWMHNGTLGGHAAFKDWARRYFSRETFSRIQGTTDSEYLFGLFLEQWEEARRPHEPDALAGVLRGTLALVADLLRDSGVSEPSTLNLAVTDGRTVLATRHTIRETRPLSLSYAKGVRLRCDHSRCRFEQDPGAAAVVIASEPLFPDAAWQSVEPGRLLMVTPNGVAGEVPL